MEKISQDYNLSDIPLFAGLSEKELSFIKERSFLAEYKKDEIIYSQGAPADAFYCVILGRVVVYAHGYGLGEEALEYLHRGQYFGIISLLTQEAHSVTAKALNDSVLLVIKKSDFEFILSRMPVLAIDLSRTLSRRLKNKDITKKSVFESKIISIFSSYAQSGKTIYALNLALSLIRETKKSAIILDVNLKDRVHNLSFRLGLPDDYKTIDLSASEANLARALSEFIVKDKTGLNLLFFDYDPENTNCLKKLIDIFSILVNNYHYIILDLPSNMDPFVFNALNQSDLVHILTSPETVDLKRTHSLTERLESEFNFKESKIKIVINEYKFSKLTYDQQWELLHHDIFATLPKINFSWDDKLVLSKPDCEYSKAIRRISRQTAESVVGLVLGVGAGYGFCHIGVLKVMEEENIPVDIICGASMGAIIAALWTTGKSSQEILAITDELRGSKYIKNLVDFTFPALGFLKGRKLFQFLKRYLGNKTFYDTKIPLKVIASDIKKREPIVIDRGQLLDALMASCAMPGLFRPFRFKEDLLLDGGVTNPLPTEVLFKMGVKKIIAVNVTPSKENIIDHNNKMKEQVRLSQDKIRKGGRGDLFAYLKNKFSNSIFDIVSNSFEVLQSEMSQKEAQLADIVLHPDTRGLHWLEIDKAREFAERGEKEARKNLDKIKQLISD